MTRVPGLTPFSEDRPDVDRKRPGRVPVRDQIREAPELRPTARPLDTYAHVQTVKDDNLDDVVNAFSALNPALLRFGSAVQEDRNKLDPEVNTILSTAPTVDAALQHPKVAGALSNAKHQELLAARVARETVDMATQEWATANREGLDVEEFIRQKKVDVLGKYGGEGRDYFTNEFLRLVEPGLHGIRQGQAKYNVDRVNEEKAQGAASLISLTIDNGRREGQKPEEIAAAVYGEITGNAILAKLDPGQQKGEVMNAALKYAEAGDVDLVKALVSTKGPNGLSLLEDREHGHKAVQLLEKADTERRRKAREEGFDANLAHFEAARSGSLDKEALLAEHKANPGRMTDEYVQRLIAVNDSEIEKRLELAQKIQRESAMREAADRNATALRSERRAAVQSGQLHSLGGATVVKENGETQEIDAEKNIQLAVDEWLTDSDKLAQAKQESPQQRFSRELPVVLENGIVHPGWKRTLGMGYRAAAQATISGGMEKAPQALREGLAMYNDLKDKAPHLLGDLLGAEAEKFYDYMNVATSEMEMGLDQAMVATLKLTRDRDALGKMNTSGTVDNIRREAQRAAGGKLNQSYVMDETKERATVFAGLGNSTDDAIRMARESVERTHVDINGHYIPRHDKRLPPDFKELVEERLKIYAHKHGKAEGVDWDDLTIQPSTNGTGAWEIVYTNGLRVDDRKDGTFTLNDLRVMKQNNEALARQAVIKNHKKPPKPVKSLDDFRDNAADAIGLPERNRSRPKQ